jgi:hypothetical protein
MNREQLDKVMKPYWELRFESAELKYFNEYNDPWYGFVLNNDILVGCPTKDLSDGTWFYAGIDFAGGADLFGLDISGFRLAMVRYLNKTYNLDIKSIL